MNKIQRVIWIVLDSVGMGAMPDAKEFGDVGSNTIGNTSKAVGGLHVPNMQKMGLGNIDGMTGVEPVKNPVGMFGRLGDCLLYTSRREWKDYTSIWNNSWIRCRKISLR